MNTFRDSIQDFLVEQYGSRLLQPDEGLTEEIKEALFGNSDSGAVAISDDGSIAIMFKYQIGISLS